MNTVKKFFKELKRVRWPSGKEGANTFIKSVIFIGVASLILFGLAIGFTMLWNDWGVGING